MRSWLKFAILGSTYARALGNAAARSGASLPQGVLSAIASRPNTQIASGLADRARGGIAGAVAPTPHQQTLQAAAAKIPNSGEGLPGQPGEGHATARFMFNQHFGGGRTQMTQSPAIQPLAQRAGAPTQLSAVRPARGAPLRPSEPLPPQVQSRGMSARRLLPSQQAMGSTEVLKVGAALPSFLPHAAGAAIPLAVGAGILAHKPGIHSNVKNLFAGKGSTLQQDTTNEIPEAAMTQASAIHQALLAHGLNPSSMRIGIDAPPGSGKTTLARALAKQTGMHHYGLDWEPGNAWKSTIGMGRNVEHTPHAPRAGEILEHYLLNRTHDPELFDAQIHLKRDPNVIREQLNQRGNAAYIGDTMDLDKSLGVADLGFDTLDGESIDLGNGTYMKLRPQTGWGNQLDQHLAAAGIDARGLSRHEKLLSLHSGQRTNGAGWTPYVKNPFSGGEMAAIGASVPLGVMAARSLMRRGVPH